MLKTLSRRIAPSATLLYAAVARAAGDSGTSSAGEMQVSGTTLALLAGGVALVGVVVWLVTKVVMK